MVANHQILVITVNLVADTFPDSLPLYSINISVKTTINKLVKDIVIEGNIL